MPSGFTRTKIPLLSEHVHTELRRAIFTGRLKPGEKLVESRIARQLGISQAPVREALKLLAQERLVVIVPHRGAFVSEVSKEDLRQAYALRAVLEGFAAKEAATRITDDAVDRLEKLTRDMVAAASEGELVTLLEYDMEFHRQVCELTENDLLTELWERTYSKIRAFMALVDPVAFESAMEIAESHSVLTQALAKADAELASRVFADHCNLVWQRIDAGITAGGEKEAIVGKEN